jgi:hypothetical protein
MVYVTVTHPHRPIGTIDELCTTAQSLDQRWWQQEAKKKGHTFTLGNQKQSDPNAMQVDATCQGNSGKPKELKKDRGSYIKHMQGKCYGCGSTDHTKKEGNHECDVCNHCGKTGHRSLVTCLLYKIHQETSKGSPSIGDYSRKYLYTSFLVNNSNSISQHKHSGQE